MNNLRIYIVTLNRIYQKRKKLKLQHTITNLYYQKMYIYKKLFFKYLILGLFKNTFIINLKEEHLGYIQSPFGAELELFLIKICMKIKIIRKICPFGLINSIGNLFQMSIKTPYPYENLFSNMIENLGFIVIDENLNSLKTKYTICLKN